MSMKTTAHASSAPLPAWYACQATQHAPKDAAHHAMRHAHRWVLAADSGRHITTHERDPKRNPTHRVRVQ